MEFTYKCDNCGECCKNWNPARYDKTLVDDNGICKYLNLDTNLCTIYDTRPDFCRVEKWWRIACQHLDWNEYVRLTKIGCDMVRNIGGKE